MRVILFLVFATSLTVVYAEVPFTFASGTPARASEVNDNFDYLDARLGAIEARSGDCRFDDIEGPSFDGYDASAYSETISFPGQQISIATGVDPMTVVQVPFVEFGSNDIYTARYPFPVLLYGSNQFYINTYYSTDSDSCFDNAVISGFKAKVLLEERRSIRYFDDGTTSQAGSSHDFLLSVNIKVGSTVIVIPVPFVSITEQEISPADSNDDDLTDDLDTLAMKSREDVRDALFSLVNYINITRLN